VKNRLLAVSIVVLMIVWRGDQGYGLPQAGESGSERAAYLGFDRNEYPGDQNLAALRRTFSYTGYWLNVPPGAKSNTWTEKRKVVQEAGFGFLVLFNGRLDAQLKKARDAGELGRGDAAAAVGAAKREGFREGTIIFLDQEEGGRMLPEQKTYIYAWADGVSASGFRAGIYASGVAASEGHGVTVITAEDIQQNAGGRNIVYWVTNDACPPSPGWRRVCGSVAVCADAEAARRGRPVSGELRSRWELLRAGGADFCGRELGVVGGSVEGEGVGGERTGRMLGGRQSNNVERLWWKIHTGQRCRWQTWGPKLPRLRSGFRQRARTPAKRLNFDFVRLAPHCAQM
jgi:Domain of unknown function (DUF1906)